MTAPNMLPQSHGGIGTGRPGIFGRVLPAVFGNDPSMPMDPAQQRVALRDALMTAGTGMAMAAGGPRSYGQFAPTPIASVLMGLQAGREAYQGRQMAAMGENQRRGIMQGLLADPSRRGLLGAWARLAVSQPQLAQQVATMASSHAAPGDEPMTTLRPGEQAFRGPELVASGLPAVAPTRRTGIVGEPGRQRLVDMETGDTIKVYEPRPRGGVNRRPRDSYTPEQVTRALMNIPLLSAQGQPVSPERRRQAAIRALDAEFGRHASAPAAAHEPTDEEIDAAIMAHPDWSDAQIRAYLRR